MLLLNASVRNVKFLPSDATADEIAASPPETTSATVVIACCGVAKNSSGSRY